MNEEEYYDWKGTRGNRREREREDLVHTRSLVGLTVF